MKLKSLSIITILFLVIAMLCTPALAQQTFRQGIKVGPIGGVTSSGGNFAVRTSTGTNKFTVAAASGNTVISGTLTVAGAITHTGATTQTGALTLSSTAAMSQVNAAGASANPFDYTGTLGIMNGSDDFTLFDVNVTNANHTGTNTIQILDVAAITGDAEATETAINIGSGWDSGLTTASPIVCSSTITGLKKIPAAVAGNATLALATYPSGSVIICSHAAPEITLPAISGSTGVTWTIVSKGATSFKLIAASACLLAPGTAAKTSCTWTTSTNYNLSMTIVSDGTNWYVTGTSLVPGASA